MPSSEHVNELPITVCVQVKVKFPFQRRVNEGILQ